MSNENEDIWTAFKRVLTEHGPIEIEHPLDEKLLKQAVEAEQELIFLRKCVHYVWENDLNEEFFKYFAGQDGQGPIVVSVNCNDLFFWGCADEERVLPENFHLLEKAYQDLLPLGDVPGYVNSYIMGLLFCCMSREMRPQTPYYYQIKRLYWPLFHACGPVREGQADVEEYIKMKEAKQHEDALVRKRLADLGAYLQECNITHAELRADPEHARMLDEFEDLERLLQKEKEQKK